MIKIEQRGRGRYMPLGNLSKETILDVLHKQIEKEQEKIEKLPLTDVPRVNYSDRRWNVMSLFSGCGGMDLGLLLAGLCISIGEDDAMIAYKSSKNEFLKRLTTDGLFKIVYAVDNFAAANETYGNNSEDDIVIDSRDIRKISRFPDCDMIIGGFPCPGYSEGGPRILDDERNFLYLHFVRALIQTKPKVFVAENVSGLLTMGKGIVFEQMKHDFASVGYVISTKLLNAADYGVPQLRERVFIIGVRDDLSFTYEFEKPSHSKDNYVSLRESIGDLETDPGSFYKGDFSSMYMSRNRKKNWNQPSFTIQASGRQAPLHPSGPPMIKTSKDKWTLPGHANKHRRLSVKEIARIQTFPDWYAFSDGESKRASENSKVDKVYKQIGNAVPILLSKVVMLPIARYVREKTVNKKRKYNDDI